MIEAAWHAVYHSDLGTALLADLRSWRWFLTRLAGLMVRDTPTLMLFTSSGALEQPARREWTPQAVHNQLAAWAKS